MRLYYNIILSLLSFFSINFIYGQKGVRIAYVDVDVILKNLKEYQNIEEVLNNKVTTWQEEIKQRKELLQKSKEKFEVEKILLTDDLIIEKKRDIEEMEETIVRLQEQRFGINGDLAKQRESMLRPIQEEILTVVQKIAKQRKYDFVFDRSANFFMLYSNQTYDISEQVLKTLKRQNTLNKIKQTIIKN